MAKEAGQAGGAAPGGAFYVFFCLDFDFFALGEGHAVPVGLFQNEVAAAVVCMVGDAHMFSEGDVGEVPVSVCGTGTYKHI